ncbi:hypothetical protein RB628_23675 [Streptomyces sp. ADMS]|uniref:hypothetical protein n=1 Tax=Streptomyces sp. ADMS TaxID=3071415 RepID=UPI00296F2588|nr:hypothetical protein [Streptomyces sp. ADMS]MDW4908260.1 hypothetical protein [Streptomyces sp. ADMS]
MTSPPGGSDVPDGGDYSGSSTGSHSIVCARCGTQTEGPQLTWTCCVENGTRHYLCDTCARENLRAIEGRLDSAWW